jgi:hypothetical protein
MAAKTIKINATYQVVNAAGGIEAQKVIQDNLTVSEVTQLFPQVIPGNTVDASIDFGGVTLGKRVYIATNFPVKVKFNSVIAPAFDFGAGSGWLESENGITAMFVSTGPNATELEALIAGD